MSSPPFFTVIPQIVISLQEFTFAALKTSLNHVIGGAGACELSSAPFFTVIPCIVILRDVIPLR